MSAQPHPRETAHDRGDLLRMRELAQEAGVPAATIKHYLREGLLPEPIKTAPNMAYYPREFVERVKLIKQLQEERFLPLKVIKEILEQGEGQGGAQRLRALIDLEDRVLERVMSGQDSQGMTDAEVRDAYDLPDEVMERLERLEVLTPTTTKRGGKRFGPEDVQIVAAIGRMRSSGYSERLGFTVYDALIYKRHLEALVHEEIGVMMERLAGEMDTEEAADLLERAIDPIRELVAAMRAKLLISELQARRAAQRQS
ncbi:MAG: MerR family transcriptional regulator [Solirubrobacterales bacterium]